MPRATPTGPSTAGRKPSRSSRWPSGSTTPRKTPSRGSCSWGSSQTDRNTRSIRSPAPSGPAAIAGASGDPRVDRQLERGQEQVVLGPEVVVHQRRVDPGGRGDRADRRAGVPLGGEQRPRLGQDRRTGVWRAGPASASGGGCHDHTVRRGEYLPGSTPPAAARGSASPGTTTQGRPRRRVEACRTRPFLLAPHPLPTLTRPHPAGPVACPVSSAPTRVAACSRCSCSCSSQASSADRSPAPWTPREASPATTPTPCGRSSASRPRPARRRAPAS